MKTNQFCSQAQSRRTIRGGHFLNQMGLTILVATFAAGALVGCSDTGATHSNTGYSAATGIDPANAQTNSSLPGPRYYQSNQDPYHQN